MEILLRLDRFAVVSYLLPPLLKFFIRVKNIPIIALKYEIYVRANAIFVCWKMSDKIALIWKFFI